MRGCAHRRNVATGVASFWTGKQIERLESGTAVRCRNYAALLRTIADEIEHDGHRRALRQIAENYESMAGSLERAAKSAATEAGSACSILTIATPSTRSTDSAPLRLWPMPDRDKFRRRANEVRKIATGIFDQGERDTVLLFVDDCEKRFGEVGPATGRRPARSSE